VLIMVQLALSTLLLWPSTCTTLLCCRGANLLVGITYALNASTLIMAHMCKEPFVVPGWTIAALSAAALNAHMGLMDQALLVWALDAFAVAAYLHWVVVVIRQICTYLDINCLTIRAKAQ
jgi:ethanolaminephosphotransferase